MIDLFGLFNRKEDSRPIQIIVQGVSKEELTEAVSEAILKAEEEKEHRLNETKTEDAEKDNGTKQQKLGLRAFFKAIKMIFRNKGDDCEDLSVTPFAFLSHALFRFMSIIFALLCIAFFVFPIVYGCNVTWNASTFLGHVGIIIGCLAFVFTFFMLFAILWGASNSIIRERDKNYVVAVFSGIVSFAALVVALVALFKGVG